jgi:hypothetical protein
MNTLEKLRTWLDPHEACYGKPLSPKDARRLLAVAETGKTFRAAYAAEEPTRPVGDPSEGLTEANSAFAVALHALEAPAQLDKEEKA